MTVTVTPLVGEFDRQAQNLVDRGYPRLLGISSEELLACLAPLRSRLETAHLAETAEQAAPIPFVLVVAGERVRADETMLLVERHGRAGFSIIPADDLQRFQPIEDVRLPGSFAYLLLGVDTGAATLNVTPDSALETLRREQRSPLTIDEGVALVTHFPESIQKNRCFSLLGSRCGDRRVTAVWISQGRPKLGWCWAGNPHTWLGSASCAQRVGA